MAKKSKKPNERLISSVLDDLKKETADPSVHFVPGASKKQNPFREDLFDATKVTPSSEKQDHNKEIPEATISVVIESPSVSDKTTVLASVSASEAGPEKREKNVPNAEPPVELKLAPPVQNHRASAYEAQFLQAENLKIAQQRIIELEKDIERLRKESEILTSANEIARNKIEDLTAKVQTVERQKYELKEINESELQIFRDGLLAKDEEIQRLRGKVEELDGRLANDLRKIRVRERELENRLELSKMEKTALIRTKDETILELKRRSESLESDIQNFQHKIIELNHKIEENQDQFSRTIRALRIALTNLEVSENTSSITLAPLKKAQ